MRTFLICLVIATSSVAGAKVPKKVKPAAKKQPFPIKEYEAWEQEKPTEEIDQPTVTLHDNPKGPPINHPVIGEEFRAPKTQRTENNGLAVTPRRSAKAQRRLNQIVSGANDAARLRRSALRSRMRKPMLRPRPTMVKRRR